MERRDGTALRRNGGRQAGRRAGALMVGATHLLPNSYQIQQGVVKRPGDVVNLVSGVAGT